KLSRVSPRPWLCTGDFNEICAKEKTSAPRPRGQIEEFRACLTHCQLTDLGYAGHRFTWSNHRETPDTVRVRLDRACATANWQAMFTNAQ
ncbi:UNVERIFIED_CONTAM: hypothetical protein Slati_1394300, partial [Sesamum latifolium]